MVETHKEKKKMRHCYNPGSPGAKRAEEGVTLTTLKKRIRNARGIFTPGGLRKTYREKGLLA
jgi:hypothetical protein